MKRIFLLFFATVLTMVNVQAGELELRGTFQGENLYVKNPFAASGVGFCVYEVTVNGQTTTDEINSSAFEIDLGVFQFTLGEAIIVGIKFKDDCEPKVLNPEVLNPRATFEVVNLTVSNNKLNWTTTKEAGALPFIVEQYRWNKWVKVGEVQGNGSNQSNTYSVDVRQHTGENKFRIKQVDYRNKPRYSQETKMISTQAEVTFSPNKVDDKISFSSPTLYEIYDEYGGIVFKGYGSEVNVAGIEKGRYYINYDNKMERFTKK
ncbi:hypothetical protein KDU71_04210 [Carboxylicivirga sediminis]|uniref:T9SS C-terminal target domain-containing protein n=1 Tax=Carboxylicivirga sediminis TaxID=2006564 RepID=A0A941F1P3_9BACT|nr:hypothetical protein [Carboxylicivirga sediminis]MBR8534752.1 hypothetical protein [Carboxylicivirga sediminis]